MAKSKKKVSKKKVTMHFTPAARGAETGKKKAAVKPTPPVAKPPVGEEAPAPTVPKKGDIVRAFNKNFLVESVSKRNRVLKATHLTYIESRITTNLSREITFDEVHTLWQRVK